MNLDNDFASLCILSYNRPQYLREGLVSLQQNTQYPHELFIHDDGSKFETWSDGNVYDTLSVANQTGATVIQNAPGWNQGQGIALNRMFGMSKGDPICKLDQDLLYTPGWLNETVRLFNENPEIGLIGLLHYYFEPVDTFKTVLERHDDWSAHTHILGSGFAVRRKCYEELGPFEEHSDAFAEDWTFQVAVSSSENWKCALPKADLVKNERMGIPHSTVVEESGKVHTIHKSPYIITSGQE